MEQRRLWNRQFRQRHAERIVHVDSQSNAHKKMKRILELQERGVASQELREVYMQRCKSSASREALARLLAASDGSVGTSASASGSSEASRGSGGFGGFERLPPRAAAARRKGSTLQWLGGAPADAEGDPPSKRMKLTGPMEDGKDDKPEVILVSEESRLTSQCHPASTGAA